MNWRSTVRMLDWAVPIGFGIVLWMRAPLRTALEFGGDEGYELMKGFLVSLGHPLYREVWNDQPPLHTELLALLFRIFGPSAYVARLLSVGFAMALVAALYRMVTDHSGRVAGLIALALLVSSSSFVQLCVSVMIELPAMALALAAVWMWLRYFASKRRQWLILSGVLFGCALQVKLTAVIFLPALAAEYAVRRIRRARETNSLGGDAMYSELRETVVWCGAVAIAFSVVAVAFYRWNAVTTIWMSHFSYSTRHVVGSAGFAFRPESLLNDLALLVPAAFGVVLICYNRRCDLLFPAVLLATALVIHLWHRPYWYYYNLHFAIPMAWLGALGIVAWFREICRQDISASLAAKLRAGIGWLGWSMLVSLVVTLAPEKAWNELTKVSAALPAQQDAIVIELRKHAAHTRWVFTDRVIYAFWAALPVPPELAVVPSKRVWSGQLSDTQVATYLERYRPEQVLLLSRWMENSNLSDYIQTHYQVDPAGRVGGLYYRNR